MFTAICDHCGKEGSFEPLYRRKGDLDLIFLKCPECETEFLVAVTDSALRRDIETFDQMARNIRNGNVTEMFIEDVRKIYQENLARGKSLRDQYLNRNEANRDEE